MDQSILTPVLALILWTFVIWILMYATRLPAMRKYKVAPQDAKHPGSGAYDAIPSSVRAVADNYNHLHEQPTVFYALVFYIHLAGIQEPLYIWLAWGYVGLRIVHSLMQMLWNYVPLRFFIFVAASVVLMVMAGMAAMKLF